MSEIEIKKITHEIFAKYVNVEKNGRKIGKWINQNGKLCSTEEIAIEWYESQGYEVKRCKTALIRTLVGTFLTRIIQDPNDPQLRTGMRHSTRGWTMEHRDTPIVHFKLPDDFGSKEYYERRMVVFDNWFKNMRTMKDLRKLFEELLNESISLRDYLWVNEDYALELARIAFDTIPSDKIIESIEWTIRDFWKRQVGWPSFLAYNDRKYLFVKVKSQSAKFSPEEMTWLRWANIESRIPCEICRVKKQKLS